MVNYTNSDSLLEEKSKLYDKLLINIEKQNQCVGANFGLLANLQEEWLDICNSITCLDAKIQTEISKYDTPLSPKFQVLLQQLAEKAKKIKKCNELAMQISKTELENLKIELKGVKIGQQTACAYKTVTEIIPTYIDKKS